MRNLEIKDGMLELYDDEMEKIENFVKNKGGKIIWWYVGEQIKDCKKELEYLPWVSHRVRGIMFTPLRDI